MGAFKFEFVGVGGHGCQRDAKQGEKVFGCRRMDCPDCLCKEFVETMRAKGFLNSPPQASATFTHWPGQDCQVVDDLAAEKHAVVRIDNDFANSKNKPPAG